MAGNYDCIAGAVACLAVAIVVVPDGFQPDASADHAASGHKALRLAQGKLNLDAPPTDFRTSKTDEDRQDVDEASKVRSPSGGVSLSVSGSVGAEMSTAVERRR